MHLSVARLCLDCQEIHDKDRCPLCTSDAFGFITRWVKPDATPGHTPRQSPPPITSSKVDSYRQIVGAMPRRSRTQSWMRKGGLVMAAGYLARLGWQIAAQHRGNSRGQSPPNDG